MRIQQAIEDSIKLKQTLLNDTRFMQQIQKTIDVIVEAYGENKKVLFCGNGGSAADAQHLAAELSGRFYYDRPPLYAEALHVNTSYLTAVANDYSYDDIFARILKASGHQRDVLVGISTSGNSKNVVKAFEIAKQKNITTIALTGEGGGQMGLLSDILPAVPSKDTPRIQESHIMIGHIICEMVEKALFPQKE